MIIYPLLWAKNYFKVTKVLNSKIFRYQKIQGNERHWRQWLSEKEHLRKDFLKNWIYWGERKGFFYGQKSVTASLSHMH